MTRLVYPFIRCQDQHRHEDEHCQKTDSDALCKRSPQIRADAESHHAKRQESDHRRKSARQYRRRRAAQRLYHSLFRIRYVFVIFLKAMEQEYKLKDVKENTPEQLEKAAEVFKEYFTTVVVN